MILWWPGPGLALVQAQAFTARWKVEIVNNQVLENTGK